MPDCQSLLVLLIVVRVGKPSQVAAIAMVTELRFVVWMARHMQRSVMQFVKMLQLLANICVRAQVSAFAYLHQFWLVFTLMIRLPLGGICLLKDFGSV